MSKTNGTTTDPVGIEEILKDILNNLKSINLKI